MKKLKLLFLSLLASANISIGQTTFPTESDNYVYWQPNRGLKVEDFQGDGTINADFVKYCNDFNLCTVASLGLFSVLDVPKKKTQRGKFKEKVYFVPAFQKSNSYILKLDSTGIDKQKIIFDMYEVSARWARQRLAHLQDSLGGEYGIVTKYFKSVNVKATEMKTAFVNAYTKDIYVDKRVGAYEEWRGKIDTLLTASDQYATKPKDCYRFINNEPIDEEYIWLKE